MNRSLFLCVLSTLVWCLPVATFAADRPVGDKAEPVRVLTRSSTKADSVVHNGPVKDFEVNLRYKVYDLEVNGWSRGGELQVELTRKGEPVSLIDKEPHILVKVREHPKRQSSLRVHHSVESLLKGKYWGSIGGSPERIEEVEIAISFHGKQGTLRVTFTGDEIRRIKEEVVTKSAPEVKVRPKAVSSAPQPNNPPQETRILDRKK